MVDQRPDMYRRKERAALVSVFVKLLLMVGKFVAAGLSGSLALASEAGNNLGDVAATLLTFYSIRAAHRPADEDHQFGHGKVEAVAALAQTGFLFALAVFILIEAGKRFLAGHADVEPGPFSYAVLVASIVIDGARWLSLRGLARASKSTALAADALNFATDIVASAMALAGILAAAHGFVYADSLAALGVAVFVAVAGYRLGRETVATLVDAAPKGLNEPIRRIIGGVPGVIAVRALRLRPTGLSVNGEAVVAMSRTLSIERVAAIKRAIDDELLREAPDVRVVVTAEPVALDDETVIERVLMVANRRRVPIHHVTVQRLGTRKSVSFDAEFDGRQTLTSAHDVITALEAAIGDELGEEFEIESHIEPMDVVELDGRDCDAPAARAVTDALLRRASETGALSHIHDVRVRATQAGIVVNYHCFADAVLSVDAVHAHVDELDRKVRADCMGVIRIVGHAEPRGAEADDAEPERGLEPNQPLGRG